MSKIPDRGPKPNKYATFLNAHYQLISAFAWRSLQRYGKGTVIINQVDNDRIQLGYATTDQVPADIRDMVERYDSQSQVLVRFPEGVVLNFSPPESPQRCFEMINPQIREFVIAASPNYNW